MFVKLSDWRVVDGTATVNKTSVKRNKSVLARQVWIVLVLEWSQVIASRKMGVALARCLFVVVGEIRIEPLTLTRSSMFDSQRADVGLQSVD